MTKKPSLNHSQKATFILHPTLMNVHPSIFDFIGEKVKIRTTDKTLTLEGKLVGIDNSGHQGYGNVLLEDAEGQILILRGSFVSSIVLEGCGETTSSGKSTTSSFTCANQWDVEPRQPAPCACLRSIWAPKQPSKPLKSEL